MDVKHEQKTLEVDDYHWWYRGRRRIVNEAITSLSLSNQGSLKILDAGCGSGRNMVELSSFGSVVGIELSAKSVEIAKARNVGEVVQSGIEKLPFADSSFDLAVSLDVIEHVENDKQALTELRRVVRPGGHLVLTVPAYQFLWSSHDELNHHYRRYTRKKLLTNSNTKTNNKIAPTVEII